MLEKDKCLKKISCITLICFFFISDNLFSKNIDSELLSYNNNLKNSSFLFIQTDGKTVEEGIIYIGSERIRVEYKKPQKTTIVLSKKRGMYINHELMEVEYFDTNKSFIKIFFKILIGENFYKKNDLIVLKDSIVIKNNFEIKDKIYKVEIIYENKPIKIRKVKVLEKEEGLELGFFSHNSINPTNIDFSLINPYLN